MKILKITALLLALLAAVLGGVAAYVRLALPNVGPPPDLHVGSDPELVVRGEYLARHVTVCVDCHSERDWTMFAGPIVPGTEGKGGELFGQDAGLPGEFYASNITPAALRSWTDGELARAITAGVTRTGEALFPIMPYPAYAHLTPRDLEAIIAYVRTLAPIENAVADRQLAFPMNLIVRTIPQAAPPARTVDPNDPVAYGKYLVQIAACAECHTPAKDGAKVVGMELAGGFEFRTPAGAVRSRNITPDVETGIGSWDRQRFVATFKAFAPEHGRMRLAAEAGYNTPMPWAMYGGMTEEDLAAIYDYLRTVPPIRNAVPTP